MRIWRWYSKFKESSAKETGGVDKRIKGKRRKRRKEKGEKEKEKKA